MYFGTGQKSEVRITQVAGICYRVFFCGPMLIYGIPFIFGTNTIHKVAMCHAAFPSQKVNITFIVPNFFHVRSSAPFLFDRFVSYLAQIQPMRFDVSYMTQIQPMRG